MGPRRLPGISLRVRPDPPSAREAIDCADKALAKVERYHLIDDEPFVLKSKVKGKLVEESVYRFRVWANGLGCWVVLVSQTEGDLPPGWYSVRLATQAYRRYCGSPDPKQFRYFESGELILSGEHYKNVLREVTITFVNRPTTMAMMWRDVVNPRQYPREVSHEPFHWDAFRRLVGEEVQP